MLIKKIQIKNFKSFKELSIEPANFNVLIGPNASGKTNFLQIFRFIRDIMNNGLQNAISLQGGADYLRNIHLKNTNFSTTFHLEFAHITPQIGEKWINNRLIRIKPIYTTTDFTIQFVKDKTEYSVEEDILIQDFEITEIVSNSSELLLEKCKIELHQEKDKIWSEFLPEEDLGFGLQSIIPSQFADIQPFKKTLQHNLFIENANNMPYPDNVNSALRGLSIYDFDTLKDNTGTSIAGKVELEDNGVNIAIVLRKILADKEQSREFFNYLRHLLPFVKDIEVEQILDKNLEIKFMESYTPDEFLHASLMSSGSMMLIAIIIALFFEKEKFIVFEELGGRVHPFLISRIVDLLKDASQKTQIFITTHNPEIVKYTGISNVFCIARDIEGYSLITHTPTKEDVIEFIKNEIGLEELFVQNLLSK